MHAARGYGDLRSVSLPSSYLLCVLAESWLKEGKVGEKAERKDSLSVSHAIGFKICMCGCFRFCI